MSNGKEVLVLVILIFVVLVSAAKAEIDNNMLSGVGKTVTISPFDIVDGNSNAEIVASEFHPEKKSSLEIGVDAPSSMSEDPDEYGLVVTLKALF